MIPKVIHYCWLSSDPIPEKLVKCMESWKRIIPDYKFIKWDFTMFDIKSSDWVREAFDNKKYAFAADYIRLYAVYTQGGIYLDMDMEIIKRFDDLLNNQYMLAYEGNKGDGLEAGCFGADIGAEFIGRCLNYYNGRHFIREDGSFDQKPLPKIMQEELNRGKINSPVYNHDYFTAKSFTTGVVTVTDNTYSIHHFAGTWKTEKEKKIIEYTNKLSKILGVWLAQNLSEFYFTCKFDGIQGEIKLMIKKIIRKISQNR